MHNRNTAQTHKRHERSRHIRRVLWGVLALNLVVSAAKYIYGSLSGSVSMQADGIHSLFDSAGSVVGLVGIAIASRPADEGHPYGHGKFETFASAVIGTLLLFAAFKVGFDALSNLFAGASSVEVTPLSYVVMAATLVINIAVTVYERTAGKRLDSEILKADAAHTLSDALVSLAVIAGLALVQVGFRQADSMLALVVGAVILYTAFCVFRQAAATLSDKARIPVAEILRVVSAHPGVEECHCVRTRGIPTEVYLDFHLLVNPQMSVQDSHDLAARVEQCLHEAFPAVADVIIHIEPNTETERLEGRARQAINETRGPQ
jgi:cation diffusion facilitator family transporter